MKWPDRVRSATGALLSARPAVTLLAGGPVGTVPVGRCCQRVRGLGLWLRELAQVGKGQCGAVQLGGLAGGGAGATKPLVTGAETTRNLAEMRRQAAAASARVTWMTPTACDTARIAAYPPFQGQQIWLQADDLRAVGDAIRTTAGTFGTR
jgi:hypothetical protein